MKKGFTALFILIPIVLAMIIFISPDRQLSENENRTLKTLNTVSKDNLQDDIESYLSDQFVMREEIVSVKSRLFHTLGKNDINGCYICSDRLVQKITDSDIDRPACKRYADRINKLAQSTDTYVMYVASAGVSLPDSLPANAMMYDYEGIYNSLASRLGNATLIDVRNALCNEGSYYKTDHHWTSDGSYNAYLEWCRATNSNPRSFEFKNVTDDFYGTLYSKALIDSSGSDTIKAPVINDDITVTADGVKTELYDYDALKGKDKYNFFEGGNHGILTIENKSVNNGKALLVMKDSFANSFVPYLIGDYSKIIMLDERYTFLSADDIIKEENVTQILVLKEIIA